MAIYTVPTPKSFAKMYLQSFMNWLSEIYHGRPRCFFMYGVEHYSEYTFNNKKKS